jgi:heptosyltransferase-2
MGTALGFHLPTRELVIQPRVRPEREILIHTGAAQPVRVWPLDRFRSLVVRLRQQNYRVQVACDPDQQHWWGQAGEANAAAPRTMADLLALIDRAGAFIGNDSGPGHLAAFCGVPTFTLFGPQLPNWFAPLHPNAQWLEGKACPYKPCFDSCRFPTPFCLWNVSEEEVWTQVSQFVRRLLVTPPTG